MGNAGDDTAVDRSGDELRFVGSRGSVIQNLNGTYTMFMSGADCQDGDSDSFQQIFTSTSSDGINWSAPVPLITDDPTFSASAEQDAAQSIGDHIALGISAYYSGRTYDPNVIDNGNGNLTMVFSGYRTVSRCRPPGPMAARTRSARIRTSNTRPGGCPNGASCGVGVTRS